MLSAGALAVDPERLLWTPGKKNIFIPAKPAFDIRCDVSAMINPIDHLIHLLDGMGEPLDRSAFDRLRQRYDDVRQPFVATRKLNYALELRETFGDISS